MLVRQRAKIVVELLVDSDHLEEERARAANIKEKMGLSSTYSNAKYNDSTSKTSSTYQGMGSSYQGMGSNYRDDDKPSKKYGNADE